MKQNAPKNDVISIEAKLKAYLTQIPASYKKTLTKSVLEGKSRATAIKAKCHNCVGYEDAHRRIRECSNVLCPLWRFRPYQAKRKRNNSCI